MGASARSFNGALPGLTLKAWALVQQGGTLTRGFNVTSVTKGAAGVYTLNFTANLTATTYVAKAEIMPIAIGLITSAQMHAQSPAIGSFLYAIHLNGASADASHFIAVYE